MAGPHSCGHTVSMSASACPGDDGTDRVAFAE